MQQTNLLRSGAFCSANNVQQLQACARRGSFYIIYRHTPRILSLCRPAKKTPREYASLSRDLNTVEMGRPVASKQNKELAPAFANLVSAQVTSRGKTIARSGEGSVFYVFAQCFPEATRLQCREGLTQIEFNKFLQNLSFPVLRKRKCRQARQEKQLDFFPSSTIRFAGRRWRNPDNKDDLAHMRAAWPAMISRMREPISFAGFLAEVRKAIQLDEDVTEDDEETDMGTPCDTPTSQASGMFSPQNNSLLIHNYLMPKTCEGEVTSEDRAAKALKARATTGHPFGNSFSWSLNRLSCLLGAFKEPEGGQEPFLQTEVESTDTASSTSTTTPLCDPPETIALTENESAPETPPSVTPPRAPSFALSFGRSFGRMSSNPFSEWFRVLSSGENDSVEENLKTEEYHSAPVVGLKRKRSARSSEEEVQQSSWGRSHGEEAELGASLNWTSSWFGGSFRESFRQSFRFLPEQWGNVF